jgi:cation transport regulator ChaC
MDKVFYFSYGSNMSTARLGHRTPSARAVAVARLQRHRLRFHKRGKDSSGKCDAEFTDDATDVVYGVVFEIAASEKLQLDEHEGLNRGYDEKRVLIWTEDGKELEALTYYATSIDPALKPYDWYKEHVVRGAREHGLPREYVESIAAVEAVTDPDGPRCERELGIYPDWPG